MVGDAARWARAWASPVRKSKPKRARGRLGEGAGIYTSFTKFFLFTPHCLRSSTRFFLVIFHYLRSVQNIDLLNPNLLSPASSLTTPTVAS